MLSKFSKLEILILRQLLDLAINLLIFDKLETLQVFAKFEILLS